MKKEKEKKMNKETISRSPKKVGKYFLLTILVLFVSVSFINAESNKLSFLGSGEHFQLSPLTDGLILGTGLALNITDFILDYGVKLNDKSWDGILYNKDNVNPIDRFL